MYWDCLLVYIECIQSAFKPTLSQLLQCVQEVSLLTCINSSMVGTLSITHVDRIVNGSHQTILFNFQLEKKIAHF